MKDYILMFKMVKQVMKMNVGNVLTWLNAQMLIKMHVHAPYTNRMCMALKCKSKMRCNVIYT